MVGDVGLGSGLEGRRGRGEEGRGVHDYVCMYVCMYVYVW